MNDPATNGGTMGERVTTPNGYDSTDDPSRPDYCGPNDPAPHDRTMYRITAAGSAALVDFETRYGISV